MISISDGKVENVKHEKKKKTVFKFIATNLGCLYGRKEAKLKILMIFLYLSA